jgi:hypothetical protein
VKGRVNVFAQEAGAVRRRLDCDGLKRHSIFFLCLGVGGQVRATRRLASIERTYQERVAGVPGVSGSEQRKAGGAWPVCAGLQSASETGGCGVAGMTVGRMCRNALLGRFRCGFDAVAGHRGYVPCGRGGEIVDL